MKKIMFAAAVAAGMVAFGDAIESANIVGYQDIVVPNGYSMFTVTFKKTGAVGYSFDVKDIQVLNSAGEVMDDTNTGTPTRRSRGKIKIQKMDSSAGSLYGDHDYKFNSQSGKGWCDGSASLSAGDLTLQNGEGFAVTSTQGDAVKFRVSGEVVVTPISMAIPNGYAIIGNMTPNTIDVRDIKVLNSEGLEMNDDSSASPSRRSRGKIKIQKMDSSTGNLYGDHDYKFNSQSGKGWCDGSASLSANELMLAPGETIAVTSTQGDAVYFKFPAPVSE